MDYKNELNSDDDFDCSNNSYGDSYTNNNSNGFNTAESTRSVNPNGLSKAELRKTNKPIMEKRRRARINHCLNELKSLILEAMKKDPARHTKLEKADILEMTVKYLQSEQRQQLNMAIQTDPTVIHKFKTGFVECADEVNRYICQLDGVDTAVRQRLTNHLNNCASSLEQIGSMTNFNNGYRGQLGMGNVTAAGLFASTLTNPLGTPATITAPSTIFPPLPQDLNNNNHNNNNQTAPIQMGAVQLIPSRLPSGEFALIMPNTNATTNTTNLLNNQLSSLANPPFAATSTWPPLNVNNNNNNNNSATIANTTGNKLTANIIQANAHKTATTEFNANFQRSSAFSKPLGQQPTKLQNFTSSATKPNFTQQQQPLLNNLHHNSTTTTSPPLSPISSTSSHGDDSSIMHTSSDFANSRPTTPPAENNASQHHNFSGVFSTPPSAESSLSSLSRSSTHLQQQQVSSTSGSSSELNASLKRPQTDTDSNDSSHEEPIAKKYALDVSQITVSKDSNCAQEEDEEEEEISVEDCMWRPW